MHVHTFDCVLHSLIDIALMEDASKSLKYSVQPLGGKFLQKLSHFLHKVHRNLHTVVSWI